jgi:hypothetical protein
MIKFELDDLVAVVSFLGTNLKMAIQRKIIPSYYYCYFSLQYTHRLYPKIIQKLWLEAGPCTSLSQTAQPIESGSTSLKLCDTW